MAYSKSTVGSALSDYTHLRTLPAMLSVVFIIAGMYQFGGISDVTLAWFNDYTLTNTHALGASLGAYVVAFASSETKAFDRYEDWEKAAIVSGPLVILGNEYVTFIGDLIATTNNTGPILAFVVTVVAWGVAVR